MKLRERLAELRRSRGLTLRELRDLIESRTGERLSVSYLSALERTDAVASLEVLSRIAHGYDLSLRDLIDSVDMYSELYDEPTVARYPKALQESNIPYEWKETLNRIQFRGKRPEKIEQWEAIFAMLKTYIRDDDQEG